MSQKRSVFRPEALEYKNNTWLGKFSVSVLPISLCCAAVVSVIMGMLLFRHYTQGTSVDGYVTYFPSTVEGKFDQYDRVDRIKVTLGSAVQKGKLDIFLILT